MYTHGIALAFIIYCIFAQHTNTLCSFSTKMKEEQEKGLILSKKIHQLLDLIFDINKEVFFLLKDDNNILYVPAMLIMRTQNDTKALEQVMLYYLYMSNGMKLASKVDSSYNKLSFEEKVLFFQTMFLSFEEEKN